MTGVDLEGVIKCYGDTRVIHGVDLAIAEGELCVFVGPSGCGKSTLLRMIAGLEETTGGRIVIAGEDVTRADPAERGVAMVFQTYALYPHMSVAENMGFGLKMTGHPRDDIARRVKEAARTLRLEPYLARNPKVFLFDEPLSNLDAELRVEMRVEIAHLHKSMGATMIYVTHDQTEALTFADKVVVMYDGQVVQIGTPQELFENPQHTFVGYFIGSPGINLLPCRLAHGKVVVDGIDIPLSADLAARTGSDRGNLELGIRPEFLKLGRAGDPDAVPAAIEHVEDLGNYKLVSVRMGGHLLKVKLDEDAEIAADHAGLIFPAQWTKLYQDGRLVA